MQSARSLAAPASLSPLSCTSTNKARRAHTIYPLARQTARDLAMSSESDLAHDRLSLFEEDLAGQCERRGDAAGVVIARSRLSQEQMQKLLAEMRRRDEPMDAKTLEAEIRKLGGTVVEPAALRAKPKKRPSGRAPRSSGYRTRPTRRRRAAKTRTRSRRPRRRRRPHTRTPCGPG